MRHPRFCLRPLWASSLSSLLTYGAVDMWGEGRSFGIDIADFSLCDQAQGRLLISHAQLMVSPASPRSHLPPMRPDVLTSPGPTETGARGDGQGEEGP